MGNDAKKRRLDEPTDLPLPCQPCVIALPALGVAQGGRKAAGPTTATTPRPAPHIHIHAGFTAETLPFYIKQCGPRPQ